MTRDDIIRMAREAGCEETFAADAFRFTEAELERFAHLVYEATFRDANIAASRTILDAAVLAEREACAKAAEDMCEYGKPYSAAAAIRARGQQ